MIPSSVEMIDTRTESPKDGEAIDTRYIDNPTWCGTKTKAGKPRKRLPLACEVCRKRKLKCDGRKPECQRCLDTSRNCRYTRREKLPESHCNDTAIPNKAQSSHITSASIEEISTPSSPKDEFESRQAAISTPTELRVEPLEQGVKTLFQDHALQATQTQHERSSTMTEETYAHTEKWKSPTVHEALVNLHWDSYKPLFIHTDWTPGCYPMAWIDSHLVCLIQDEMSGNLSADETAILKSGGRADRVLTLLQSATVVENFFLAVQEMGYLRYCICRWTKTLDQNKEADILLWYKAIGAVYKGSLEIYKADGSTIKGIKRTWRLRDEETGSVTLEGNEEEHWFLTKDLPMGKILKFCADGNVIL